MTKATLDPFQSALLGELLGVVDERAARRTRRQWLRRRIGATVAAATTTDSAAVLVVVYDGDRCALMARAD